MTVTFGKVTVIGVGLIGASFALAMKKKGLCGHVAGYGRSRANLENAKARGIIDSFGDDPADACADADLVFFSTPVGSFLDLAGRTAAALKKGAIVTDAGSVKGGLVHAMESLMPEGVKYIGGHPIAGSDRSGIDAAHDGLFDKAMCIVTPTADSDEGALRSVKELWQALGAKIITMDPAKHDRIYASVSHLPHVIAYALVNTIAGIDPSYLEFAGQGFRDMTRIASSSSELWRDVCMLNKENIIEQISVFQKNLESLSGYLRASDPDSVEREFRRARTLRQGIG